MPRASLLQRILDPLTVEEFAAKYFQRRPLKIRGAPDKFDFLFRLREFQFNLDRVERIRAVFAENRHARIRAADIRPMMQCGATICVTGMELAHPKLRRAARLVRSELNYSGHVSFRAYLSPPGAGFDLHFDGRVTTTLQIAGSKRWWYSTKPALPYPLYNSDGHPPDSGVTYDVPKESTLRTTVLHQGDVFCLPAGIWHRAEAAGTTSLALNMVLDHHHAGVFDSIMGMLQRRLKQDPAWRQPLPVAPHQSRKRVPQSVASALRERIDALQRELAAVREDETELHRMWHQALERDAQAE